MSLSSVFLLAALLAFVPTFLYAMFVWWLDRHEKEPVALLLVAFVWGAVPAIIIALVLEAVAGIPLQQMIPAAQTRAITEGSIVAPIVEEAVKAIILVVLFLAYKREFDNVLDGVVYGAMVGLGFAFVENILYFSTAAYNGNIGQGQPDLGRMFGLWFLRAGLFGFNHATFTAFTGAALGLARSLQVRWQKGLVPSLGLGAAMMLHGAHNALASSVAALSGNGSNDSLVLGACLGILLNDWGAVLLILAIAIISGFREADIIRQMLWEEVGLGRLTPDEYVTLISGGRRWSVRWAVLFSSGFRRWRQLGNFFDLATELAFRKHHLLEGVDPVDQSVSVKDIARLRQEIDNLKRSIIFGAS